MFVPEIDNSKHTAFRMLCKALSYVISSMNFDSIQFTAINSIWLSNYPKFTQQIFPNISEHIFSKFSYYVNNIKIIKKIKEFKVIKKNQQFMGLKKMYM